MQCEATKQCRRNRDSLFRHQTTRRQSDHAKCACISYEDNYKNNQQVKIKMYKGGNKLQSVVLFLFRFKRQRTDIDGRCTSTVYVEAASKGRRASARAL